MEILRVANGIEMPSYVRVHISIYIGNTNYYRKTGWTNKQTKKKKKMNAVNGIGAHIGWYVVIGAICNARYGIQLIHFITIKTYL